MTKLEELLAKRAELDAEISKAKIEALIPEMVDIPNRNYRVARTHVTQAQYEAVIGNNPSADKHPEKPVTNVSYHDAVAYCVALSEKTGRNFRLISEDQYLHCAGAEPDPAQLNEFAWHSGNCNSLQVAGTKKPNEFGLYDMRGNVYAWMGS